MLEGDVLIGGRVLIASVHHGYALFQQFSLTRHDAADEFHVLGCHCDDRGDVVSELPDVGGVLVGIQVDDHGGVHTDFRILDTVLLQECLHLVGGHIDALVEFGQIVAQLFGRDRPGHLVGFHLTLCQTFYGDDIVFGSEVVYAGFQQKPQNDDGQCYGFVAHNCLGLNDVSNPWLKIAREQLG